MQELDWTAIGERIKERRERLGYTRDNMAELISKSVTFCRDMEFGKPMSVATLAKLSEALDVSTDYILFGKDIVNDSELGLILSSCEDNERDMLGSFIREFTRIYKPKEGN